MPHLERKEPRADWAHKAYRTNEWGACREEPLRRHVSASPPGERSVLVVVGTGISPVMAQLADLAVADPSRPGAVLFGANTPDELVCWDELERLIAALDDAGVPLDRVHYDRFRPAPGQPRRRCTDCGVR